MWNPGWPSSLIRSGARCDVLRATAPDGSSVVVKVAGAGKDATPDGAARLEHERRILLALGGREGVPSLLAMATTDDGRPALVLEDVGQRTIEALASPPLPAREFLDLALPMASALRALHAERVIHRDVCPSNFVVGARPGTVTLVDFERATFVPGTSTRLARDELDPGRPSYLAPEQLGGAFVDHRADLYGLGATFYLMLTGTPPFPPADATDVAPARLALLPPAPAAVVSTVPTLLSAIVMKLLETEPGRRYQSAEALLGDLLEVRASLTDVRGTRPFRLARGEVRLGVPTAPRLYGRGREIGELRAALERAAEGTRSALFVAGGAGTGKTALVDALLRDPAVQARFFAGEGDSSHGAAPHAAIRAAVRSLVRAVASEPSRAPRARQSILEAVGAAAASLIETIPELGELLGPLPSLPEVGAAEARARFRLAFAALVRALAPADSPVVLVVEDLQWVDPESLELFELLAVDPTPAHLLVVGTYRDDVASEVPERAVARVRDAAGYCSMVRLEGLELRALTDLLAEGLEREPADVAPLARVAAEKTGGAPLYVHPLLDTLRRRGALAFDPGTSRWELRVEGAALHRAAGSALELLVEAIAALDAGARRVLTHASCIGGSFELSLLAAVMGEPEEEVARALWPLLARGLVEPSLTAAIRTRRAAPVELCADRPPSYAFSHERVRAAASGLLDEAARQALHVRIARELLAGGPEEIEANLFAIVEQLAHARDALERHDREQLDALASRAAHAARAGAAHRSALRCLLLRLGLFGADAERALRAREDRVRLRREAAESAHLSGEHELSERLAAEALEDASTVLEKAELYQLAILASATRGAWPEALRLGREALALFGVDLPEAPGDEDERAVRSELEAALAGRSVTELGDLPLAGAPEAAAMQALLASLVAPAWFTHPGLLRVVAETALRTFLELGNGPPAPFVLATYGSVLASRGAYGEADQAARAAVDLATRIGSTGERSKVMLVVAEHVAPWRRPARQSIPLLEGAVELGARSGELEYGAHARTGLVSLSLMLGRPLDEVLALVEETLRACEAHGPPFGARHVLPYRQLARCLRGVTSGEGSLDDDDFSEAAFLVEARDDGRALATYRLLRLEAAYLFGAREAALSLARASEASSPYLGAVPLVAEHGLYACLALSDVAATMGPEDGRALLRDAHRWAQRLATWAEGCPANFAHEHLLAGAAIARAERRDADARDLAEGAVEAATREGLVRAQALAHELLARLHREAERPHLAGVHAQAAIDAYARWGATAKVERLERENPGLASPGRPAEAASPSAKDLAGVLEVSRALSSELAIERVMERVLALSLGVAGAERGALVLEEESGPWVCASGTVESVSLERQPLATSPHVPASIVEHVRRTREPLALADAQRSEPFAADPHVKEHATRSVLSVPILAGARLLGVLYFENDRMAAAFTRERLRVLRALSSHIASALSNGMVFETARKAIEARDAFLSVASHELRTPVTSMRLSVDALTKSEVPLPPDKAARAMAIIDRQLTRLVRLLDEVLSVSRIGEARLQLEREDVDVAALVHDVVERFGPDLQRAGCTLTEHMGGPLLGRWDPNELDAVFVNLLTNAMKFGARRPIEVRVARDGAVARVTVRDHGIGIAKERLPSIFQRFEQAISTRQFGGLGLGLYIAKSIVDAHDGRIDVTSTLGEGTTFVVELPLVPPTETPRGAATRS